jgi:hypothetical protein
MVSLVLSLSIVDNFLNYNFLECWTTKASFQPVWTMVRDESRVPEVNSTIFQGVWVADHSLILRICVISLSFYSNLLKMAIQKNI